MSNNRKITVRDLFALSFVKLLGHKFSSLASILLQLATSQKLPFYSYLVVDSSICQ